MNISRRNGPTYLKQTAAHSPPSSASFSVFLDALSTGGHGRRPASQCNMLRVNHRLSIPGKLIQHVTLLNVAGVQNVPFSPSTPGTTLGVTNRAPIMFTTKAPMHEDSPKEEIEKENRRRWGCNPLPIPLHSFLRALRVFVVNPPSCLRGHLSFVPFVSWW